MLPRGKLSGAFACLPAYSEDLLVYVDSRSILPWSGKELKRNMPSISSMQISWVYGWKFLLINTLMKIRLYLKRDLTPKKANKFLLRMHLCSDWVNFDLWRVVAISHDVPLLQLLGFCRVSQSLSQCFTSIPAVPRKHT